jgi:hypothetical protein
MSKIFDITLHGVLIFEHITIKYTVLKKFQRENDQIFLCLDNYKQKRGKNAYFDTEN